MLYARRRSNHTHRSTRKFHDHNSGDSFGCIVLSGNAPVEVAHGMIRAIPMSPWFGTKGAVAVNPFVAAKLFRGYSRGVAEDLEQLEGTVERIIFSSAEDSYTVAALVEERGSSPITIVGSFASLNVGETLRVWGSWRQHKTFGRQFAVQRYESVLPSTVAGIRKYLASGMIKGVGPVYAERIVKKFGAETLNIIDTRSAKLLEVPGLGRKRVAAIKAAWDEQKAVRDIMIFLQGHGVGAGYAAKIFKQYGANAIALVRENPYRLAADIRGIGFRTADQIAHNFGMASDALQRLRAGICYALETALDDGHTCLPLAELTARAAQLLGVEEGKLDAVLAGLVRERQLVKDEDFVYLAGIHGAEKFVAGKLAALAGAPLSLPPIQIGRALEWAEAKERVRLSDEQRDAVRAALSSKLMVITGGPGVGKTTIIRVLVKILGAKQARMLLCAPTGRAAKTMAEKTGHAAQTIHRLLKYDPTTHSFAYNEKQPLACDLMVVDEASMLDLLLARHLLAAMPVHASVVFVGDVDQLPSVGAGNFLADLIESGVARVARLTQIFRQAEGSRIITSSHRINHGQMPELPAREEQEEESDFYFIERNDPARAAATVLEAVCVRIPERFGLDPFDDIQVISPMHKGTCGVEELNRAIQARLNPRGESVERFGRIYRVGDRVMQIKNNYDKDVFNGDLGRIERFHFAEQELLVRFDERRIVFDFGDLDELAPAYAITVHKSQGSEYPCVVMPLLTQHYVMLQRNLIYTAVTRAKKLLVLIGSRKALQMAIANNKTSRRYSRLRERLKSAGS